jgi:hypothetical protein
MKPYSLEGKALFLLPNYMKLHEFEISRRGYSYLIEILEEKYWRPILDGSVCRNIGINHAVGGDEVRHRFILAA